MSRTNRRLVAFLLVGLVFVSAGCLTSLESVDRRSNSTTSTLETTTDLRTETTAVSEGDIRVYRVEAVPESATVVNATDDRMADVQPLQNALNRALTSEKQTVSVHVEGKNFTRTEEALQKLDGYTGSEGPAGYYVRKDSNVFVVFVAVYE